jgi:hypothetical protein
LYGTKPKIFLELLSADKIMIIFWGSLDTRLIFVEHMHNLAILMMNPAIIFQFWTLLYAIILGILLIFSSVKDLKFFNCITHKKLEFDLS